MAFGNILSEIVIPRVYIRNNFYVTKSKNFQPCRCLSYKDRQLMSGKERVITQYKRLLGAHLSILVSAYSHLPAVS